MNAPRLSKINAGGIRYESESFPDIGPLFLDCLLDSGEVDLLCSEMKRRNLNPNDIHAATIREGVVDFDLREPFPKD